LGVIDISTIGNASQTIDTTSLASAATALGITLDNRQLDRFVDFYLALTEWGAHTNLTAVKGWDAVQSRLFLDSLAVSLAFPAPRPLNPKCLDVGSGAGFPGIPLKIAFEDFDMTLLEATGKKARFLEHVCAVLGLDDVQIVNGRSEDAAHELQHREGYDMVFARGVAEMSALVELTLPFCKVGGRLIASKPRDAAKELSRAEHAIRVLGGGHIETIVVPDHDLAGGTSLVVVEKIRTTPARYPRRPGMPAKRPLGS
jgi:16S rRNA (guanine527-N7)-methyltransferase